MKRKLISAAMVPFVLFMGLMQSSCFGSFTLTQKVYNFNKGIGGDDLVGKFLRSVVMIAFDIIPVYGVAIFVDVVILNLIEFWTGSNPMAMQEGEVEQQLVHYAGKEYLITATRNQFKIEELLNGLVVEETLLQFCEEDMSWSAIRDSQSQFLASLQSVDDANATFRVATAHGMKSITVRI